MSVGSGREETLLRERDKQNTKIERIFVPLQMALFLPVSRKGWELRLDAMQSAVQLAPRTAPGAGRNPSAQSVPVTQQQFQPSYSSQQGLSV